MLLAAIITGYLLDPGSKPIVDSMHKYYIGQFENLKLLMNGNNGISRVTKPGGTQPPDGRFGTSRIESSRIKSHTREGGDPGYSDKNYSTAVEVYGNHGRPLNPINISLRYRRNESPGAMRQPKSYVPINDLDAIKKVVKKWNSSKPAPFIETRGIMTWEARPVLLTKKECLSCHTGMKLNDPVAVMVYKVTPKAKKV